MTTEEKASQLTHRVDTLSKEMVSRKPAEARRLECSEIVSALQKAPGDFSVEYSGDTCTITGTVDDEKIQIVIDLKKAISSQDKSTLDMLMRVIPEPVVKSPKKSA